MKIAEHFYELIGNTPLLELCAYSKANALKARLVAKLECFNPLSSVKDRVGLAMIEDAEKNGRLKEGGVIIEPTSGNTGIGLAFVAAAKGYKAVIVMPSSMSIERQKLLKALGAQLVLTDGAKGMSGAIAKAEELRAEIDGSIIAGQFVNPANPAVHKATTAQEIWRDTDGKVDIFVAGVGTGGTISGVGEGLREHNPNVKIVAAEPADSPLLSGGAAAPHKLQGIGANFIPEIYNKDVVDEVITVTTDEAYAACRGVAKTEGLLCGISSGAALHAARVLAQRSENKAKLIVVLLPDTGERYLSTDLFDNIG
ncbi:MAG: cysteine synthase A [Hydrogenoanaerobacterium sp.]